jgi:thiamine biosynthesis lipoprotein
MNPDRRTFLSLGVGALAVAAMPAAMRRRPPLVRRRIPIMGTVAEIAVPTDDHAWAHAAIDAGFGELRLVERTMSRFRPESDIGRLNAAAGEWVEVSSETEHVLRMSLGWAGASGGRFDPCLGSVARLWDGVPTGAALSELPEVPMPSDGGGATVALAGGLEVESLRGRPHARLTTPGAEVDLGGIAKGYAVDRAADALRARGVVDGLVNVGGDLVALGRDSDGRPWLVGVQNPDDASDVSATLEVENEAIATSGDYVRWFEHEGRRHHHLIDPATGASRSTAVRSLTVRADRCIDADAAATALFGAPARATAGIIARTAGNVRVLHEIQEETT